MILQTPMGRTPGFLLSDIKRQAKRQQLPLNLNIQTLNALQIKTEWNILFSERRDANFFKQVVVNLLAPPVHAKIRGVKETIPLAAIGLHIYSFLLFLFSIT